MVSPTVRRFTDSLDAWAQFIFCVTLPWLPVFAGVFLIEKDAFFAYAFTIPCWGCLTYVSMLTTKHALDRIADNYIKACERAEKR